MLIKKSVTRVGKHLEFKDKSLINAKDGNHKDVNAKER